MDSEEPLFRNLTVLFGFFFVLLSTFVSVIVMISTADFTVKITFFGIAVFISIGGILIGIELLKCFADAGVGFAGKWGLVILIWVVPAFYVIGTALLLGLEPWWLVGGILVAFIIIESPKVFSYYSSRRDSKATADVGSKTE